MNEKVSEILLSLILNSTKESLNEYFESRGARPNLMTDEEWERLYDFGLSLFHNKNTGNIPDLLNRYRLEIASVSSEMSRDRNLYTDDDAIEFLEELDHELVGVYMVLYNLEYLEYTKQVEDLRAEISSAIEEILEESQ